MTTYNAAEQKALNAIEKVKSALAEVGLTDVQLAAVEETLNGVATHVTNHAIDREIEALYPPPAAPEPEPEQSESNSGDVSLIDTPAPSSPENA